MNPMSVHRRGNHQSGWNAVTAQEGRIIALVAEGLTNREVGRQLFISRHTVDTHLRHVFTKLEVTSRVALTRAYVERLVDQGHPPSRSPRRHPGADSDPKVGLGEAASVVDAVADHRHPEASLARSRPPSRSPTGVSTQPPSRTKTESTVTAS
jgi:DNA-binding CsgD family transcriptional regulator